MGRAPQPVLKKGNKKEDTGPPTLNEHVQKFPVGASNFKGLVLNKAHLTAEVLEAYQNEDLEKELEGVTSDDLMTMHGKLEWTDDLLGRYFGWGESQAFKTGEAIVPKLKTVVEYAERDESAPADIKPKLRFVTKCLHEASAELDARELIIMLACHGGLCHVQKQIGIRMGYNALSGNLKSEMDASNIHNQILRLLVDTRETSVEQLYRAQHLNGAKSLNSHGLVGYRNELSSFIGLPMIPDQHAGKFPAALRYKEVFFERFYTVDVVLDATLKALKDHSLNYNATVAFLQYNRPSLKRLDDPEEFLYHCFDFETGAFLRETAAYILWKANVLEAGVAVIESHIEDMLFPEMPPEEMDEIRSSKDKLLSGEGWDNSPLPPKDKDEIGDEIRSSIENAQNHECD